MAPKLTGAQILEQWRQFISEHGLIPRENGGPGHKLAVLTRQKRAAGHLSREEEREIDRLKASQPQDIVEGASTSLEQPAATSADPRLNQESVEEPASASGIVSSGLARATASEASDADGAREEPVSASGFMVWASGEAMPGDMEWLRLDPGFLEKFTFDTDEAKEETRLYYDGLKMLFCYLRGSLSEKAVCQWEARLGQEFFDGQLRDIYLNAQAVARKLDEQDPLTVETIANMIINTPTEELDTLLQLFGGLDHGAGERVGSVPEGRSVPAKRSVPR